MCGFDINDPKIKERAIGKHDLTFSFVTHMSIVPSYAIVCPIRIVETCKQLSHEEWTKILALKYQICETLKKSIPCRRLQLCLEYALVLEDYLEWKNGNSSIAMPKP